MSPSGNNALPGQLVAQLTGTHERVFQVQFVDLAHQCQIGRPDWPGQLVDRATADVQKLGLARDGKLVGTVDHGFALTQLPKAPALVSALSKKSFSSASWPILVCSGARFTGSPVLPEPGSGLRGCLNNINLYDNSSRVIVRKSC